jgi:hypothetical protein
MKFSTLALLSLATTADAAKGKKSSAASGNAQPGNFKVALWGDLVSKQGKIPKLHCH